MCGPMPPPWDSETQCKALTTRGSRCTFTSKEGTGFCALHNRDVANGKKIRLHTDIPGVGSSSGSSISPSSHPPNPSSTSASSSHKKKSAPLNPEVPPPPEFSYPVHATFTTLTMLPVESWVGKKVVILRGAHKNAVGYVTKLYSGASTTGSIHSGWCDVTVGEQGNTKGIVTVRRGRELEIVSDASLGRGKRKVRMINWDKDGGGGRVIEVPKDEEKEVVKKVKRRITGLQIGRRRLPDEEEPMDDVNPYEGKFIRVGEKYQCQVETLGQGWEEKRRGKVMGIEGTPRWDKRRGEGGVNMVWGGEGGDVDVDWDEVYEERERGGREVDEVCETAMKAGGYEGGKGRWVKESIEGMLFGKEVLEAVEKIPGTGGGKLWKGDRGRGEDAKITGRRFKEGGIRKVVEEKGGGE
ncbi:hypothetical protein TrCOL_g2420 [Triparma columacea]|uniref:Uncharacterized protein n=1 Tax=Triparma columacea TaxID=722753 RepID=A0A9W7LFZ3_9STRA|nr:hypothetical protein TrCOL_g2420 [Triparma columacea]